MPAMIFPISRRWRASRSRLRLPMPRRRCARRRRGSSRGPEARARFASWSSVSSASAASGTHWCASSAMASPRVRAFRSRAIYFVVASFTAIGRRIPLRTGRLLGRGLGTFAYFVVGRQRKKALANLAIAFPDWSGSKRHKTIHAMFRHFGMSLFEIAWLPNLTPETRDRFTKFEGVDQMMQLIDEGRGFVIFTAHCGNWEWLSYTIGLWGRPLSVMQRERDEHGLNRFITELRARSGAKTIDRGSASSARDMIKAIRGGGMLAFVIDQNIRSESVKVPFFGTPAPTVIGPARLAKSKSKFARRPSSGRGFTTAGKSGRSGTPALLDLLTPSLRGNGPDRPLPAQEVTDRREHRDRIVEE